MWRAVDLDRRESSPVFSRPLLSSSPPCGTPCVSESSAEKLCRRTILLVAIGLVAGAAAVAEGPADEPDTDGILVLRNGRVLEGRIRLLKEGYQVATSSRRVVIPRDLVEVEGHNLIDAYRKLRARMPDRSASRHIALARWCLSNGLNQQALVEFREVQRLAPKNIMARSMVDRLIPTIRPGGTVPTVRASTALMSRDAEPVEALGGLPRDVAAMFVQRIQPLLSHGCGTGSCHGASSGRTFRLEPIGRDRSGFGVRTRKNLEATLGQLDLDGDSRRPLLEFARRPHGSSQGGRSRRWIRGDQLRLIESWVQQVATSRVSPLKAASGALKANPTSSRTDRDPTRAAKPGGKSVDVFDPSAFNRETRRREANRKRAASRTTPRSSVRTGRFRVPAAPGR